MTTLRILILGLLLVGTSCHPGKGLYKKKDYKNLQKFIETSEPFNRGFTGFVLFDPARQHTIYSNNANRYFTPASNTKIWTLYTALTVLNDSMEVLRFSHDDRSDTLYIQGTGHPGILNPLFPQEKDTVLQFIGTATQPLVYCTCNFEDKRFGSGWMWDDAHFRYQKEKSPMPLYGNAVAFSRPHTNDSIGVYPSYFNDKYRLISDSTITRPRLVRAWDGNQFTLKSPPAYTFTNLERPYRTSPQAICDLLRDSLQADIRPCPQQCVPRTYQSITSQLPADQLYTRLMQPSDNFIAEQLLLLCANRLFDTLSVERTIEWAKDSLYHQLSDPPKWVDASGLSRYNMFTPRSMVAVLHKLYMEFPEERLFTIFPAGGQSGTIKNWYGGKEAPYVFAKTGTLRHVHCLSGYVVTRRGRRLIFSFMHNNFPGSTRTLKKEMQRVLKLIYDFF